MANEREQNRDLTLPPDTYLFQQSTGKGGIITVFRGPCVVNQTGQDEPVRFDPEKRTYRSCSLEQAVQPFFRANEGDYVILDGPSETNEFPTQTTQQAVNLKRGRRIVIPGPCSEALWPGQVANVVEGHRLRSNQYVVAMVYNAEEAETNWGKSVFRAAAKTQEQTPGENQQEQTKTPEQQPQSLTLTGLKKPQNLTVGTRLIIKGSDVSFYIPCTGVEVLRDDKTGRHVREAVTLEQLEYCCLVDENGKKDYPRGPKVVFPEPTQTFEEDKRNRRKFKPIELNTINGIHLKVTADFEDRDLEDSTVTEKRQYKEGEELFVTGKSLSIFYPREELSIVEYGQGNRKHFSTAIPKGEGRYVINRESGAITLLKGPIMFLADPRNEIPVRRVLSDDECNLWYPNNAEALQYNRQLAEVMQSSPSGRSGMVSEGDYRKKALRSAGAPAGASYLASNAMISASDMADMEDLGDDPTLESATIRRGTAYTQPRTMTLNTKYDGVPRIEIWPGYAILIVGAEGSRRVVQGPSVQLLAYDEKLGFMELSTGKPKSTDRLYKTSYLKVQNNQVSDVVPFESSDHVRGNIKISLRVNFESETDESRLQWFEVDNYVKFLTDHVRSILAGMAKKMTVAHIKGDYINLVRNAILGERSETGRKGLFFEANGMRVVEVEVLELALSDARIAKLLDETQHKVVESDILVEQTTRDVAVTKRLQQLEQEKQRALSETDDLKRQLEVQAVKSEISVALAKLDGEIAKMTGNLEKTKVVEDERDLSAERLRLREQQSKTQAIGFEKQQAEIKITALQAETNAAVARLQAAKDGLMEALATLSRDDLAEKLTTACNLERYLTGSELGSSVANILSFAPSLKAFLERPAGANGNRLTGSVPTPTR